MIHSSRLRKIHLTIKHCLVFVGVDKHNILMKQQDQNVFYPSVLRTFLGEF